MKDRIAQIMQKEGLSSVEFADKIEISPSSLSHIFNGRNKPSLEVIMRIHKAYPHINLNWLLYGEGSMQEEKSEKDSETINGIDLMWTSSKKDELISKASENSTGHTSKDPDFTPKELIREEIKYIEKPHPKITEIRIFFDNGTYEIFKPEK